MKNTKKILNIAYYAVLAAIIVVALTLVISVFPITGNIRVLTVLSGSMEPAIHTGSVVVIKPVSGYDVGDVITFTPDDREIPTTHRITAVRAEEGEMVYTTKGDANETADTTEVRGSEVLGKVYITVPYFGYVVDFARKPLGLMLLIVVPGIIIVYEEIKKVVKEVKNMRKTKAGDANDAETNKNEKPLS